MSLWTAWFRCVLQLRGACSRSKTFSWMVVALVGFSVREDLLGVTSWVRGLRLRGDVYKRLLHTFHNRGICVEKLTALWVRLVLKIFQPVTHEGYFVCVADGIKVAKDGRKMPAVKKLHQHSGNNSKSPFIMGHSFQALSLLVSAPKGLVAAVPLASRIHEGVIWSNRDSRTLLDKLATLFLSMVPHFDKPLILIADAFYASRKMILPLLQDGQHFITRARSNSVGYHPASKGKPKKRKGRAKKYGRKVRLRDLVNSQDGYQEAFSPFFGEETVRISYLAVDLLWRPVGRLVRFVVAKHPKRGTIIVMSTDTTMEPTKIIELYGHRFQIELGFRQAIHTLASYQYHFWMRDMAPIKRDSGNQYMHRRDNEYRRLVRRKLDAYHRYVQLGCVAQGLLMFLGITRHRTVWRDCLPWFRTMKVDRAPSELIVRQALRYHADEFLHVSCPDGNLGEILDRYRDRRYFKRSQVSA